MTDKVIADLKITSRYPKVIDQLPALAIEPGRLVRFGYNPSIEAENGFFVLAYRYHDGDTLQTRLALAQISHDGKVVSNRALPSRDGVSMEDPRLFWFRGKLHMCWVESNYPNMPLTSVVKYGELQGGELTNIVSPEVEPAQKMEKNWVPMPDGDTLQFIYQTWPKQLIYRFRGPVAVNVLESEGFRWPWGEPRGGTVPLPCEGKLIRFFHSGTDFEHTQWRRRYYIGAVIMDPAPPHAPLFWSKEPILYGSEIDDVPYSEWGKCGHRKPKVVFPGGAIKHAGGWLLAVGINDYRIALIQVSPNDLHL